MKTSKFKELLELGHEFEFLFNGKNYSISIPQQDKYEYSFCEMNKTAINVSNVDELFNIKIENMILKDLIAKIPDKNISIY